VVAMVAAIVAVRCQVASGGGSLYPPVSNFAFAKRLMPVRA